MKHWRNVKCDNISSSTQNHLLPVKKNIFIFLQETHIIFFCQHYSLTLLRKSPHYGVEFLGSSFYFSQQTITHSLTSFFSAMPFHYRCSCSVAHVGYSLFDFFQFKPYFVPLFLLRGWKMDHRDHGLLISQGRAACQQFGGIMGTEKPPRVRLAIRYFILILLFFWLCHRVSLPGVVRNQRLAVGNSTVRTVWNGSWTSQEGWWCSLPVCLSDLNYAI